MAYIPISADRASGWTGEPLAPRTFGVHGPMIAAIEPDSRACRGQSEPMSPTPDSECPLLLSLLFQPFNPSNGLEEPTMWALL